MAVSVQPRAGGKHQLRVTHKLLPQTFFHTFEGDGSEAAARAYGKQLQSLLDSGIVPSELLARPATNTDDRIFAGVVRAYLNDAPGLTDSDSNLLATILRLNEIEGLRVSGVTVRWAEGYVARLKKNKLTPGTIRKRIGALARVLEWHLRLQMSADDKAPIINPLRMLPDGYSVYSSSDRRRLGIADQEAPRDVRRDQRLPAEREAVVRWALDGGKREDRERALPVDPAFTLLFDVIISTGVRLSEGFTLRVEQIDFASRFIRVDGSKGVRGEVKPRTVPIDDWLAARLADWCRGRTGLVFPFWDGTKADKVRASARLSSRFRTLFAYAGIEDFTEHDLRHEATCRWFLMRDERGAWVFSEIEICRIMGWTKTDMALRYASLRGKDLSARMPPRLPLKQPAAAAPAAPCAGAPRARRQQALGERVARAPARGRAR